MEVATRDGREASLATQPNSSSRLKSSQRSTRAQPAPSREKRGTRGCGAASRSIRMGGDERRPLAARRAERGVEPLVDADEGAAADGNGVRGEVGVEVVVGQLEPGHEQQVVLALGPSRLRLDLGEVVAVIARVNPSPRPRLGQPRVVAADDVIGDADHVEAAAAVEVDQLGHRQLPVAPAGVRVELAEQRLDLAAHRASSVSAAACAVVGEVVTIGERRGEWGRPGSPGRACAGADGGAECAEGEPVTVSRKSRSRPRGVVAEVEHVRSEPAFASKEPSPIRPGSSCLR